MTSLREPLKKRVGKSNLKKNKKDVTAKKNEIS